MHLQNKAKQQQQQYDQQKRAQADQIRQQRQQQQQQQQFASRIPDCFHNQQQLQQRQLQSDDEAPEVPVRRSSQTSQLHQHHKHVARNLRTIQAPEVLGPKATQYTLIEPGVKGGRQIAGRSHLPRSVLRNTSDGQHIWRAPVSGMVLGKRPTQPPPPPPPPPPPAHAAMFSPSDSLEVQAAAYRLKPPKSRAPKNIWSPSTSSNEDGGIDNNDPEGLSSVFDEQSLENMAANVAPPTSSSTSGPHRTLAEISMVSATGAGSTTMSPQQETIVERAGRKHMPGGGESARKAAQVRSNQFGDADYEDDYYYDDDAAAKASNIHDDDDDADYFRGESGEVPLEEQTKDSVVQPSSKPSKMTTLAQNQQTEDTKVEAEEVGGIVRQDAIVKQQQQQQQKRLLDVQGEQIKVGLGGTELNSDSLLKSSNNNEQNNRNTFLASLNHAKEDSLRPAKSKDSRSYSIATSSLSLAPKPAGYKSIAEQQQQSTVEKYWTLPSGLAVATGVVESQAGDLESGEAGPTFVRRRAMSSFVKSPNKQQLQRLQQQQQQQQQRCNSSTQKESSLNPASESEAAFERDMNRNFSTAISSKDNAIEYSSVVKQSHVNSGAILDVNSVSKQSEIGSKQHRKTADQNKTQPSSTSTRRNTIQAIPNQHQQYRREGLKEEEFLEGKNENMPHVYNAAIDDKAGKYATTQTKIILDERIKSKKSTFCQNEEHLIIYNNSSLGSKNMQTNKGGEVSCGEQQTNKCNNSRDEWFRQMYKQMHKQTPEKSLLQAVNSQQPDTTQIRIKLKSPKTGKFFFLLFSRLNDEEKKIRDSLKAENSSIIS